MHDTPLNLPYLDISRSSPISCLKEREIDLSEGQGHIPYMGEHVVFEGQGWPSDHPVSIPFTLSF